MYVWLGNSFSSAEGMRMLRLEAQSCAICHLNAPPGLPPVICCLVAAALNGVRLCVKKAFRSDLCALCLLVVGTGHIHRQLLEDNRKGRII